ncbi:MAG: flagellin [Terracidiphilus sp.]
MSLGVLNNLSAVYAENNLNNTNNSLSTVLQQLSSGSKINSGADDAAGLSLVNGLQANQQALNQSQTNATEGVGLLQVADGALSQVTSLLNRAVTLATEASNGTLNATQDVAANQEYQSILSEVNNIGTTTTFNQEQVFNSNTNIYTGDSSNAGASISALNIRSLSSSNLGDTSGTMAYGSGNANSNVFINLSLDAANGTQTTAAQIGDVLNAAGNGTAITVNTLSSSGTVVANVISVGGTSGYANTAQGMINAINNSGLGVTASFTTAAVAGATVAGTVPADDLASQLTNTGIMISGAVGVGNAPTSASYAGTATTAGAANADILSGSITLQVGNGSATTITMAQVATADQIAQGAVTLDDLKSYINSNAGLGVTAGDATGGKLTLASTAASHPSLNVTSDLVDNSIAAGPAALSYTATAAYADGITTGTFGTTGITDSTAVQVADAAIGQGATSGAGVATMSYTDKAGQSLSGTDLTTEADAEGALTSLNTAIADVSAQDGYIGAMINTLNSVSQVLSTQKENVQSAQNAVQATDYASATSNMSKYEILSQTGISALAQANSVQQEVTKLLQ